MISRRIAVVSAGLSVPSSTLMLAERLTAASTRALEQRGIDVTVDVVELRTYAHDLADALLDGVPGPNLHPAVTAVSGADGLIAVTPIFSASYSGLFKAFFDVLDRNALTGKPVLMGATAGTARHCLALDHALRPLFVYLRSVAAPTAVFAASQDWTGGEITASLIRRIDRAGGELAELVSRHPGATLDSLSGNPVPLNTLVRGA